MNFTSFPAEGSRAYECIRARISRGVAIDARDWRQLRRGLCFAS